jgi:hypothetical protein
MAVTTKRPTGASGWRPAQQDRDHGRTLCRNEGVPRRLLDHRGGRPRRMLTGLIYILASVLGRNRPALALGSWLAVVGASCG